MTHHLKVWTEYFPDLLRGDKSFEVRKDDRGFGLGDVLVLQEWDKTTETYTGRECFRVISYILREKRFVPEGYCILGFKA